LISRTNISVLIATALLAILLWTVLNTVKEFGKIPTPQSETADTEAPSEPIVIGERLYSRTDTENFINKLSTRGGPRLDTYRDWLLARGFPETYRIWGDIPRTTSSEYADMGNARLLIVAGAGNIDAMYELAERRMRDNPLDALAWYDQAIVNGSVYAMIKTAILLESINDPQLQDFLNNARWQSALEILNKDTPAPIEKALAWSLAAITIGGYAILDNQHANRIRRLSAQLDAMAIQNACDVAQEYLLDTAAARRARGGTVFSIEQPPIAVTTPNPASVIPCQPATPPLVTMNNCTAHAIVTPEANRATLWICPYSRT